MITSILTAIDINLISNIAKFTARFDWTIEDWHIYDDIHLDINIISNNTEFAAGF